MQTNTIAKIDSAIEEMIVDLEKNDEQSADWREKMECARQHAVNKGDAKEAENLRALIANHDDSATIMRETVERLESLKNLVIQLSTRSATAA